MKRIALFAMALLIPTAARAFVAVQYVQISTGGVNLQNGGINVASATIPSSLISTGTVLLGGAGSNVQVSSNAILPGATFYSAATAQLSTTNVTGFFTVSSNTVLPGATFYQNAPINVSTMNVYGTFTASTNTILPGATFYPNAPTQISNLYTLKVSSNAVLPGATFYQNATTQFSSFTFTCSSCGIIGVVDGSSATVGVVGQWVRDSQIGVVQVNGLFVTCDTITLSAGDWDVSGVAAIRNNGATLSVAEFDMALSSFTNNTTTDHVNGDNLIKTFNPSTSDNFLAFSIPAWRVSVPTTTAIYVKTSSQFTVANALADCRISARRVR